MKVLKQKTCYLKKRRVLGGKDIWPIGQDSEDSVKKWNFRAKLNETEVYAVVILAHILERDNDQVGCFENSDLKVFEVKMYESS